SRRVGILPSGQLARAALVLANRLVGNPDGAAALELTLRGPRLEVRRDAVIAVTGADMGFSVNGQAAPGWTAVRLRAGDVVAFRMVTAGGPASLVPRRVRRLPARLRSPAPSPPRRAGA